MTNVTPIREVPDILGPKASGHGDVAMGYASLNADSKDRPFAPQIHKLGE